MLRLWNSQEGSPSAAAFYSEAFLLLRSRAAGMHQQLSPEWRGSTLSSSFPSFSSPPTSLLKTTHTQLAAYLPPSSCFPILSYLLLSCPPHPLSQRGDPDEDSGPVLPVFLTIFPSDSTDANYCNCVQQIVSILLLNTIFFLAFWGNSGDALWVGVRKLQLWRRSVSRLLSDMPKSSDKKPHMDNCPVLGPVLWLRSVMAFKRQPCRARLHGWPHAAASCMLCVCVCVLEALR